MHAQNNYDEGFHDCSLVVGSYLNQSYYNSSNDCGK
jgi:hypothetical protein